LAFEKKGITMRDDTGLAHRTYAQADLVAYAIARIREVQAINCLQVSELAELAGCERRTMSRLLNDVVMPQEEVLFALSQAFDVPMSFWYPDPAISAPAFPSSLMQKIESRIYRGEASMTRQIMRLVASLPAVQKRDLFKRLRKESAVRTQG
jgi:transcriptional regulator with XRE-family HTH domain